MGAPNLSLYLERCRGGVGSGHCRGGAAAAAAARLASSPRVYFQNNAFSEVNDSSRRKLRWSVNTRVLNFRWRRPGPSLLPSSYATAELVVDVAAAAAWRGRAMFALLAETLRRSWIGTLPRRLRGGGGGATLVLFKASLRRSWFGTLPRRRRGGGHPSNFLGVPPNQCLYESD